MKIWALWLAVLISCFPLRATAHPLSPAALTLEEQKAHEYAVTFRRSERSAPALSVDLPSFCERGPSTTSIEGDQRVDRFVLRCPRAIEGESLRVFGLVELSLGALVYVRFADGREVSELLTPEQPTLVLPRRTSGFDVIREYVALGVDHLITGADHVLFVAGLMFLVVGVRRLAATLTAFTPGHSVTLCLAALDIVRMPQTPVEIGIALSLVVLALEVLEPVSRLSKPWWMASSFGLLHGLGFAGALAETGLPPDAIPLSLFGFNLGVELGQLGVVVVLAPLTYWVGRAHVRNAQRTRVALGYAIGSLAAMWCIERTVAWLG